MATSLTLQDEKPASGAMSFRGQRLPKPIDAPEVIPSDIQTLLEAEETTYTIDEDIERYDIKRWANRVLLTLRPREERVLRLLYGIGVDREHTLEEVGQILCVSYERIRQIEAKALRRLKHPSRSRDARYLFEGQSVSRGVDKPYKEPKPARVSPPVEMPPLRKRVVEYIDTRPKYETVKVVRSFSEPEQILTHSVVRVEINGEWFNVGPIEIIRDPDICARFEADAVLKFALHGRAYGEDWRLVRWEDSERMPLPGGAFYTKTVTVH